MEIDQLTDSGQKAHKSAKMTTKGLPTQAHPCEVIAHEVAQLENQ